MFICYVDESGTPELTAVETTHFIFLGLAIPAETWKTKNAQIDAVKRRFGLATAEIHTAWIARRYPEQERIGGFAALDDNERRKAVKREREGMLLKKAALRGPDAVRGDRKNYEKTAAYTHLTHAQRIDLLRELADIVSGWSDAYLFAECTDKTTFAGAPPGTPPYEEAFTQVVTRFDRFLRTRQPPALGILVQDKNETVQRRLTDLMRSFHRQGTKWLTQIERIIETPLFVDSQLTSLVQIADLCAYATRRYCEKGEPDLFGRIVGRFNAVSGRLVGARHYVGHRHCHCMICSRRRRPRTAVPVVAP